jgi:hypothetical protein
MAFRNSTPADVMPKLVLLNFEGAVLKAYKNPNWVKDNTTTEPIIIKDQWNTIVAEISLREFADFIDGKSDICDSKGKYWNYGKEHENAKPNPLEVVQFIAKVIE